MLTRLLLLALSAAALPAQAMPPPPPVVVVVCTPLKDELTRLQVIAERLLLLATNAEIYSGLSRGFPGEENWKQRAIAYREAIDLILSEIKRLEKSLPAKGTP